MLVREVLSEIQMLEKRISEVNAAISSIDTTNMYAIQALEDKKAELQARVDGLKSLEVVVEDTATA